MSLQNNLVHQLNEILREKRVSILSIVKGTGLSHDTITKFLTGKSSPKISTITTIFNFLNCYVIAKVLDFDSLDFERQSDTVESKNVVLFKMTVTCFYENSEEATKIMSEEPEREGLRAAIVRNNIIFFGMADSFESTADVSVLPVFARKALEFWVDNTLNPERYLSN